MKGGEADVVYLFPDISPQSYEGIQRGTEGRDAVIRQFYVGMTRAKDKLYLYYAKERYGQELSCSRFIEELRGDGTPKPGQGEKRRQTI